MPRLKSSSAAKRFSVPLPVLAGFVVAVIATFVVTFVNYRSSQVRSVAVEEMQATSQAIRALNDVVAAVKDAETGQRGFLLTGDSSYLQPYQSATDALDRRLSDLKAVVGEAPQDLELTARMEQLVRQKLDELGQTIELYKAGSEDAALARVRNDTGKNIMDEIRDVSGSLMSRKDRLFETRRQAWVDAASESNLYSGIGSAVLFVLICSTGWLAVRGLRAKADQAWVSAGLAQLGRQLQGEHRIDELGQRALGLLGDYMGATVGAGYSAQAGQSTLRLFGGYALPRERLQEQFVSGEGLVGQAAAARQLLHVKDVPAGHLQVSSGTGSSRPAELLVAPAIENGELLAVIEFGFLRPVSEAERSLLERASEMLAVAVRLGIDRQRLEVLLEETRRQAEELQTQQEELRVNNEELEQQSRVLQESQAQMEVQQTELEQTNVHLEEQTQQLEYQREQLLKAQDALTGKARELELASQYKSEFLANMSHELRTPLNSTLILAKLLSDNKTGNLNADQVKYAKTISAAGHDLLALINDILDLSKIEAGQTHIDPEIVPIARTVQNLVEPLRPLARDKGLALAVTIAPDVPATLETDPLRLGQVLKNLLSNAIKFTEKGEVALHVSRAPGDTLSFAIKDTGIGIPLQQQALIFEAFRQADGSTHRKYGGTGLGLSISRDLAHLLGGEIAVQSNPGEGSVFTLSLPLRMSVAEAAATLASPGSTTLPRPLASPPSPPDSGPASAPAVPDQPRAGVRSILVIEDDERFAQIMCDLARDMDFECHLAHNAADGLAMAARLLPRAIVLDVNLPDFSGLGVLDQLKRNPATRHIPVHIVSVADYSQEALGRGAVGYALKPIKLDALAQALQTLEAKFTQDLRRVLVVEDDERQRESVQALLSRDDVEVVCAATAGEALEHLRGATFDCMVMDLNLPDLTGFELLERMTGQEDIAFPPVIVYTGRALSRDEEQQLRRFSKSIIIKDARSPERLLDEVTLFLHQVESELSPEHRRMLEAARSRDSTLEGRTVLIVEDDVRNVFALTSILESTGIKLQIARNGREALVALERAEASADPAIDLVLMDIMMPEMDGYTAMREIRLRPAWRRLPIIALTAKAMKDDQEKCLAAGANDYIAKPLDVEKLLSLVRVWMPK